MDIYANINSFFNSGLSKDSGKVSVYEGSILFPFSYHFRENSTKTVFFLPGAFDRKKVMPKFMRENYFEDLEDYNCISFFDPTLFLSERYFSIGWFQGNEENFYIDYLIKIVKKIVVNLRVKNKDILFFGTSAAGIPCLNLANTFPGCNVFSGNIQTNALLFYKEHVERMLDICYSSKSQEDVLHTYKNRISVDHIDSEFNLFYAQNICDEFHYKNYFLPFSESRTKINGQYITYKHSQSGHNPLPKDIEVAVIKSIFSDHSIENIYKNL